MIDPASGWFEIHPYADKRAVTIANVVEQQWFSRYLWPTQLTYDRGKIPWTQIPYNDLAQLWHQR